MPTPNPFRRARSATLGLLFACGLWTTASQALPSFARQTGEECAACHVGAFGPQLTPHGREFKLMGYTEGARTAYLGLSAMAVTSYTHTAKAAPDAVAPGKSANDNAALDEASLFFGGHVAGPVGAFVQVTYDGIGKSVALDNLDVRAAKAIRLGGHELILGATLNNNPTVQDVFNSTPAWGLPFSSSALAPEANAGTLLGGGVEMQVLGASAYAAWNDFYAELGAYGSPSQSFLHHLGIDREAVMSGAMPYWRVAYTHDLGRTSASIGTFGAVARLHADGDPAAPTDRLSDIGVDGSLVARPTRHDQFTVNARYVRENRSLSGSVATDLAELSHGRLDEWAIDGSWYRDQTYGASAGLFGTHGTRDAALYPTEAFSGSRTNTPGTSGYRLQLDVTPWGKEGDSTFRNLRLGLQYTGYSRFNGAGSNYDGAGRHARDNNTLFLFGWLAI